MRTGRDREILVNNGAGCEMEGLANVMLKTFPEEGKGGVFRFTWRPHPLRQTAELATPPRAKFTAERNTQ